MKNKKQETVAIELKTFLTPMAILLSGLMIAAGLFFGLKNGSLPKKASPSDEVEKGQAAAQPTQAPSPQGQGVLGEQTAKTSIEDDAVLGNKETAKIAIVEFSDYECPFCQRFWDQTLGQIKENYIDTGKAIFVYRDLPLAFHDPAATREANAAECAGSLGGDEAFYQFHDKIYEQTPGNGQGISEEKLIEIGAGLGLDRASLTKCIQGNNFAEELKKDAQDAAEARILGTPGFVVGALSQDGSVDGVLIKGAQPYSAFKQAIDKLLEG